MRAPPQIFNGERGGGCRADEEMTCHLTGKPAVRHSGQRDDGERPVRALYDSKWLQCPERSWARTHRWARGRKHSRAGDCWRTATEDWVRPQRLDNSFDCVSVYATDGGFIGGSFHDSVVEKQRNNVTIARCEGLFHPPRTWVGSDGGVRRVGGTKGRGQKLGAQHVDVGGHRQLLHLLMEVFDRS